MLGQANADTGFYRWKAPGRRTPPPGKTTLVQQLVQRAGSSADGGAITRSTCRSRTLADKVVRGEPAERLLDQMSSGKAAGAGAPAVQRAPGMANPPPSNDAPIHARPLRGSCGRPDWRGPAIAMPRAAYPVSGGR